jgi:hypothetical protein
MWSIYSNPDPHRFPFRGYYGPILTWILTGVKYRRQSSANSLVVDFTASGHELFLPSPQRHPLLEENWTVFSVAEGDLLPVLKAH